MTLPQILILDGTFLMAFAALVIAIRNSARLRKVETKELERIEKLEQSVSKLRFQK